VLLNNSREEKKSKRMSYVRFFHPNTLSNGELLSNFINSIHLKAKWFDVHDCSAALDGATTGTRTATAAHKNHLPEQHKPNNNNNNTFTANSGGKMFVPLNLAEAKQTAGEDLVLRPTVIVTIADFAQLTPIQLRTLATLCQEVNRHSRNLRLLIVCCPEDPFVTVSRIANKRYDELQEMKSKFVDSWQQWYSAANSSRLNMFICRNGCKTTVPDGIPPFCI
jgi:hypothetical protein